MVGRDRAVVSSQCLVSLTTRSPEALSLSAAVSTLIGTGSPEVSYAVCPAALDFAQPRVWAGFFFRPGAPLTTTQGSFLAMARGDVRIAITLACEECKHRNYQTNKSKRNNPDRVSLRKYCRWCRRHTSHRETR